MLLWEGLQSRCIPQHAVTSRQRRPLHRGMAARRLASAIHGSKRRVALGHPALRDTCPSMGGAATGSCPSLQPVPLRMGRRPGCPGHSETESTAWSDARLSPRAFDLVTMYPRHPGRRPTPKGNSRSEWQEARNGRRLLPWMALSKTPGSDPLWCGAALPRSHGVRLGAPRTNVSCAKRTGTRPVPNRGNQAGLRQGVPGRTMRGSRNPLIFRGCPGRVPCG